MTANGTLGEHIASQWFVTGTEYRDLLAGAIDAALAAQRDDLRSQHDSVVVAASVLDATVSDYMLGWVKGGVVAQKQHAVRDAIRKAATS